MTPTPFATIRPFLSGVLLRAKMPRKWPGGTWMTRPVGTSAIVPGAMVTSAFAARPKPAAPGVWYAGRETVGSRRRRRTGSMGMSLSLQTVQPHVGGSDRHELEVWPVFDRGK